MSALAMILAAMILVSDRGQAKASADVRQIRLETRLDLEGEWTVRFVGCGRVETMSREEVIRALRIQDKGEGNLLMAMPKWGKNDLVFVPCTGTYRQERDRVVIHFRIIVEKTPPEYRDNIPQGCIILHRVKRDK